MEVVAAMRSLVRERVPTSTTALARSADAMSARYRGGDGADGGPILSSDDDLAAYGLTRFPATYAAASAALVACREAVPDWRPEGLLDCGTGLGATLAGALGVFPSLERLTSVERDPAAQALAAALVGRLCSPPPEQSWRTGDCRNLDVVDAAGPFDLVTAGYLLNEVGGVGGGGSGGGREAVAVAVALWERTAGALLLVEPGRPREYRLLLDIRDRLIALGATTLAPCPHDLGCPLAGDDWCHVAARVERSAEHRRIKHATLPYEDEKYCYLAMARPAVARPTVARSGVPGAGVAGRVVARPGRRKGLVTLRVCRDDGTVVDEAVGRSDPRYRSATRTGWGDPWPPPTA